MIRVLHLLPRRDDLQMRRSLAALREACDSCEMTTRTLGWGGDYANELWAVLDLRRIVREFDVVHAWNARTLAVLVMAGAKRIVFTVPPRMGRRAIAVLRRAAWRAYVDVVVTTDAQRAHLLAHGLTPARCHAIHPPAALARIAADRATIRQSLGIRDDDFVLLAAGESGHAAEHDRVVWTGSILHVVDERYRVLLWGRGEKIDSAVGLGRKLKQRGLVIDAERTSCREIQFDDLLPAADALVVTARRAAPTLPVAIAMAGGVPVVAASSKHVAELLTDNVTALTIPTSHPRLLAQRVLDLRSDDPQKLAIVAAARARVAAVCSTEAFREGYLNIYRRTADATRPTAEHTSTESRDLAPAQ